MRTYRGWVPTPRLLTLAALTVVLTAGACAGGGSSAAPTTPATPTSNATSGSTTSGLPSTTLPSTRPASSPATPTGNRVYVALGDSLAAGYQPGRGVDGATAYPARVREHLGDDVTLVNLGCSGEQTGSMIRGSRCTYDAGSQLKEAVQVLQEHRGRVALVTIDIGGNDVMWCARIVTAVDRRCVEQGQSRVEANLPVILRDLRRAAGAEVPIAVLRYYNPYLAAHDSGVGAQVKKESGQITGDLNATISATAKRVDAVVVPLDTVLTTQAELCAATWMCPRMDIHLTDSGARTVAEAVVAALPERAGG